MRQKLFFLFIGLSLVLSCVGSFWITSVIVSNKEKSALKETPEKENHTLPSVPAFIIPHHLVAEKYIKETFRRVSEQNKQKHIQRIILLSPNHFNRGNSWFISSERDWDTPSGVLRSDRSGIHMIQDDTNMLVTQDILDGEHGIRNILPFIKDFFPQARIIPIAIRDNLPDDKADNLAQSLQPFVNNSIVILSADFSHYLDRNFSLFHDKQSLETIQNFAYEKINNLDMDCAPGLRIIMKYAESLGKTSFHLVKRSGSSEIIGKNLVGEETSHISGYFKKEEGKKNNTMSVSLLFSGDLMLDRMIRTIAKEKGAHWIIEPIKRIFLSQDMNITNLEGPVTQNQSVSVSAKSDTPAHYQFTFDPEITGDFLQSSRTKIVNIGNNHAGNFGIQGIQETKTFLQKNTISYFGSPKDFSEISFETKTHDKNIALVNYNEFFSFDVSEITSKIKELKIKNQKIIVYCHWGTEYNLQATTKQIRTAHAFIDAGADIVIGSHPHVVEPIEIYKNKAIFYSLGNFVFDQYFSDETRSGLLLGISFEENETQYVFMPIWTEKNGQLTITNEQARQKLLQRLGKTSNVPETLRADIVNGMFSLKE